MWVIIKRPEAQVATILPGPTVQGSGAAESMASNRPRADEVQWNKASPSIRRSGLECGKLRHGSEL